MVLLSVKTMLARMLMDKIPGPWKEFKAQEDQSHEIIFQKNSSQKDRTIGRIWKIVTGVMVLAILAKCSGL